MDHLAKIMERLGSIDATLVAQHNLLKDHVERTNKLEKRLDPIQRHVFMVQGAFKLIGSLGLIFSILRMFQKVFVS